MSPIIFNLLTEPVWRMLREHGIEFKTRGVRTRVPSLGFADDTALLEDEKEKLEEAVELLTTYFKWLSLALVPEKCGLMAIQFDNKGAIMNSFWTLKINNVAIQRIEAYNSESGVEEMRYLGGWFNNVVRCYTGIRRLTETIKQKMDLLTAAELPVRY